jgi:large subunit ribosomal protein L25
MSFDASVVLEAKPRTEKGKNASRRYRAAGLVPVTIYGHGDPATGVVGKRELSALLRAHGRNQIFNVSVEGQTSPVKIAEMQIDPVKGFVVHADLMRISLTEKTEFEVPIHIRGEAEGVKLQGGLLDHPMHSLRVRCLPTALPDVIHVDVAPLKIGEHIRAKDLNLGEGIELLSDGDAIVATVISPKGEEPVAEAAATAEPEVIKKGKAEEKK